MDSSTRCTHSWHLELNTSETTSPEFDELREMGEADPTHCPACQEAGTYVTCYHCNTYAIRIDPGSKDQPREQFGVCAACNEQAEDEATGMDRYPTRPETPAIATKVGWDAPLLPIPYDVVEPDSDDYERISGLAYDAWDAIEKAGAFLPATITVSPHDGVVVLATSTDKQPQVITPENARELARQLLETAEHVEAVEMWAKDPTAYVAGVAPQA